MSPLDFYPNGEPPQTQPNSPTGPHWRLRDQRFIWGTKTYVMGIVNVTPDSFSDGGEFYRLEAAVNHGLELARGGVDILDIGGQSTRPGAVDISPEVELARVIPVISALRLVVDIPISIDTTRAVVAQAALDAGADVINDVSGGQDEPAIFHVAAQAQAPIILMHRRGTPQTMQSLTDYGNLVADLLTFFQAQIAQAQAAGIAQDKIAIDPGIGFAKTTPQNIELLQRLRDFRELGCPLLIGTSRKRFIGEILGLADPKERAWGTAATCCYAIGQGVDIIRVHDGAAMVQVAKMADALWRSPGTVG